MSRELDPFLAANPAGLAEASSILGQLRACTGPQTPNALDENGRMALPAIAALLACERLSLPDLDSKAAQKASSVAPRAFIKALAVCRTLVQTSGSARNSPRRRAVTFQTLAGEIVREDVPQEVLGWATTVRQLLADESGENVDGEEVLRGIWGWVLEAWGINPPSKPSPRLLALLEEHLEELPEQIRTSSQSYAARLAGTSSPKRTPSKTVPLLLRTPTKPSPFAAHIPRSTSHTPVHPSPLKRRVRSSLSPSSSEDEPMGIKTPTKRRRIAEKELEAGPTPTQATVVPSSQPKTRRVRKSYIDGVGGGEEAVERGWTRYLTWREGRIKALTEEEGTVTQVDA